MIMADTLTKAHFRKEKVTNYPDGMKREVEALRDLYKPTRATIPLQLKTFAEQPSNEPTPDAEEYTQAEWDAWEANQALVAERAHLAAIGKGRKGKGGGKGGKGGKRWEGQRQKRNARSKRPRDKAVS